MSTTKLEDRSYGPWALRPAMPLAGPPKSHGLRSSDWRSEILQAILWLRDEGIGHDVDPPLLERFLGVGSHLDVQDLRRLIDEGLLERVGARYALSDAGTRKARRDFAAAFEEFRRPIPAVCSRVAWCTGLDM